MIKIGKLSRPHGLKGEIRGTIDPDILQRIKKLKVVFLIIMENPLPYFIEDFDLADSGACMFKFEDVNDRTEADKISGKEFFIEEINLKKTIKLTGYEFIIGYKMLDADNLEVGIIEEVYQMPANDIARLTIDNKEVLIPLTEEIIIKIDKRKKETTVRIPDGLLDIYLK